MFIFSIIIPHKNTPSLLRRCLDSIPIRPDLEVIIVDDNSNNEVVKNLKSIHRSNLQIIFTKDDKGAGHARNIGINKAQGKWILFADADDFYEKEFNNFLNDYKDSNADCIYFSVTSVNSDTYEKSFRDFLYDDYIAKYNPLQQHSEDWIMFNKWEPWNKMISRELVKKYHIQFEEISRCNDMLFSMIVSLRTQKFIIINQKLYCVTQSNNSMTFHKTPVNEFRDCLNAFKKRNVILKKINRKEWQKRITDQHSFFLKKDGLVNYIKCALFYFSHYLIDSYEISKFEKKFSN